MSLLKSGNLDRPKGRPHPLTMPKERRALFIKEWRKFRGDISQEELAGRIDMSAGNLSLLERGLINYTQDTLERLADALDCTTVDLLTRDPSESESLWSLW